MLDPAKWLRRVRYLFRQRQIEADMAEELETHRQMAKDRALKDGTALSDASAASRRAMGNVTLAREDARAEWIAPWLESVWQDLRYGVRHLRAHPVFTITTGATLLLATVLNTSFFTLFNATVLRTWPVPDAGRVVIVQSSSAEPGGADGVLMSDFEFMRKQARSFAALFAIRGGGSRVSTSSAEADEFIYVQSAYVSANFFAGLRIPMAIGRGFVPEEDLQDRPASVGIIGAGLWQRAFGGDHSVLGRTVYVNRQPVTIVGVTASSVNGMWPFTNELWMPMAAMALHRRSGGDCCVGRCGQARGRRFPRSGANRAGRPDGAARCGVAAESAPRHPHRHPHARSAGQCGACCAARAGTRRPARNSAARLFERRKPAARAGLRPQAGACDAAGDRCEPQPDRPSVADRDIARLGRGERRGFGAQLPPSGSDPSRHRHAPAHTGVARHDRRGLHSGPVPRRDDRHRSGSGVARDARCRRFQRCPARSVRNAAGRRPDCAARRPGHPQCHAALRRHPAHARPDPRLEHRPGLFAAHGFGGQGHAAGAGVRCRAGHRLSESVARRVRSGRPRARGNRGRSPAAAVSTRNRLCGDHRMPRPTRGASTCAPTPPNCSRC